MRFARPVLVAFLVLLFAVTPLSAHLSGGTFETWLPGYYSATYDRPRYRVVLFDGTGLVRAVSPGESAQSSPTVLVASWFSCGNSVLRFGRTPTGLVLKDETVELSCGISGALSHSAAIHLWTPVDASTVQVERAELK